MAYIEDSIIVADHEREVRIVIEPGYLDDRDRDSLRFMIEIKGESGELRLCHEDARKLATKVREFARRRR